MKQFYKYFLASLLAMWGCGGDEPVSRPDDRIYFPLQTGFYQIYDVEENIYSEINNDQFLVYELKTEVVDSFSNLGGGYTFVMHRSTRPTENDEWEFLDTWSAQVDDGKVVLSEGNIPYIQLAFPISANRAWDANALNTQEEDQYEIEGIDKSYELGNDLEFDNTATVEQENELNLLIRDQRVEVYAPNVGLIYKKSVVLNYCDDEDECQVGQQIITHGTEYYQVLKSYGQN